MEIKEETCEVLNTAWIPQELEEPWPLFIVSLKALGRLVVGLLEAVAKGTAGWGGGGGKFTVGSTSRSSKLQPGVGVATVSVPVLLATGHCAVGTSWGGDTDGFLRLSYSLFLSSAFLT